MSRVETMVGAFGLAIRTRPLTLALGCAVILGLGSLVVNAADDPGIRQVILEFNRPIRRAMEPYAPRLSLPIPRFLQSREQRAAQPLPMPARSLAIQSPPTRGQSSRTVVMNAGLPVPALREFGIEPSPRLLTPRLQKHLLAMRKGKSDGPGLASSTNFCVRLCDGYAFPLGNGDPGNHGAQEMACQLACPGAKTALYSAPRGAKDIDVATSSGRPYSALPTAFRYRMAYDKTCVCRAIGETQSSAALLSDFTLRRGDIAMTRAGMRHFNGSKRYPYRANAFSDALHVVTDKKEVALLRGMEAASLRGIMSTITQASVRARVISEIRQSEHAASSSRVANANRIPGGFEVMRAKATNSLGHVRVIDRRVGLVAMN